MRTSEDGVSPCPSGLLPGMAGSLEEGLAGGPQALCGCPDLPTAAQELCHCLRGLLATAAADTPTSKAASEAGSASSLSDQQASAAAQAPSSGLAAAVHTPSSGSARGDEGSHRAGHSHDTESGASAVPENGKAACLEDTQQHLTEPHSKPAQPGTETPSQPAGEGSRDGGLSTQAPDDLPQQLQQILLALQGIALRVFAGAAPLQLLAALSLQRYGLQLLEDRGLSLPSEASDRLLQPASTFAALR